MKIAAEITSPLEFLFIIALLQKKFSDEDIIQIHVLILNNHANDSAIEFAKHLCELYKYGCEVYDYRDGGDHLISDNINNYECLIIRSRLQLAAHNFFSYSKCFFRTTGNCDNSKKAQSTLVYKDLFTVEDGLSNWKDNSEPKIFNLIKYTLLFLKHRKVFAIPLLMKSFSPSSNYVEHFSIFSDRAKFSIKQEFSKSIKKISHSYEEDNQIEELFIGIWPNFKANRTSKNNPCKQIMVFSDHIRKKYPNYRDKIFFVKDHPKWELDLTLSPDINFVRLKKDHRNIPVELLLPRLLKLKHIYGFPSTCFYLMDDSLIRKVGVSVFVKLGEPIYFPERAALLKDKVWKINTIYV